MQTWVVLNDLQIPFHDRRVVDRLVLPFVESLKPYGILLNGDIVDCYAISDYTKDPLMKKDLLREIHEVGRLMARLQKTGARELIWLGGNHEDRLRRYLWQHAPELTMPATSFEELFRVGAHGFTYRPYGACHRLGKLIVTHGDLASKHSAYTARMMFEKYGNSILMGHTHRLGVFYRRDVNGVHAAYENGCLCMLQAEYAQHPNWQQGFSVVHVDKGGLFNVQQIPILNRSRFYYGATCYTVA